MGWESIRTWIQPPKTPLVRSPWQASSHETQVVPKIIKDGRHREHGQCQELIRALCSQCPGSAHHPHGSQIPPPCPTSQSQTRGQKGSMGPEHFLPHHPLTMIKVEGSCASKGTVSAPPPFHPGTSGPFPPFVTQFGFIIQALAPSHVPGSEVMDSKAGESSLVGRGVGGLLAWCHSVGRAQGSFPAPHQTSSAGTPSSRLCPAPQLPARVLRDLSWYRWPHQAPKSRAAS